MKSGGIAMLKMGLLGIALLSLLLIPQLSLHPIYAYMITAVLSALATLVYVRQGTFMATAFVTLLALYAYAMEIEGDGMMITCTIVGVVLALLLMTKLPWLLPARVAVGCVVCAFALVLGGALLPVLRKGMTLVEAIEYSAIHELPVLLSTWIGSLAASWWHMHKDR